MKITVLGGGPGGYEAAIAAAKKGAEVVLIEKDKVGGTCLNRGCIPTKALLASYEVYETVQEAKNFGINVEGEVKVDYPAIIERKNKVATSLVKGIHYLLDKNGVTYINGFGKLIDKNTIEVTKEDGSKETVTTDYVILATGSVPICPGMFKYDGKRIITSDEILDMTEAPKSLILVGGGVIGCEIGQFLAKMGTELTVVEMLPQILPTMDEDVAKQLAKQFKREKIKMITGDGIAEVNVNDDSVSVKLQSGKEMQADYLLVAIGRAPFTKGAGMEDIGVEFTERGRVKVNEYLQTSVDNIYAIGDILDTVMLAHVASKEGLVAVDNIVNGNKEIPTYHAVPGCVYTNPEVACVGTTEAMLKKEGKAYRTGTFDFKSLGKAQASGKIAGFVKVITDENDVLIGGSIVGAHATDMLQVLTTAVQLRLTAKQVGDCIFPHPTMSEAIMEALHDLHGESIHKA
jgi:dihydrolipoamide dehydrogenase